MLVFGLLLLVASGLKLGGRPASALDQNVFLFSSTIQMLTLEAEFLLGLWLVSGVRPRAARAVAVAFFAALAAVSLWLAGQGQSSCGCFGRVEVHSWATFGFDVAAVLALLLVRPVDASTGSFLPQLVRPVLGAVALLAVAAGVLSLVWGTGLDGTLARLRGEPLTVEPALTDLGEAEVGAVREFTVAVVNHTGRPLRLVGGSSSCACTATDGLPAVVPAAGRLDVPVRATFRGSPGRFQHQIEFFTDDGVRGRVTARFGGTVVVR